MGGDHDVCRKCGYRGYLGMGCQRCRRIEKEHARRPLISEAALVHFQALGLAAVFMLALIGLYAIIYSFRHGGME